jgi:hypothetical protein
MPPAKPKKTIALRFSRNQYVQRGTDPLHHDISALAVSGDDLFVACDETASIERLVRDGAGFGHHTHLRLGEFFTLPDGPDGEMDIEGLSISDDTLWVVGSHSLKRERPQRDENGSVVALDRMMEIEHSPNRYFLGCVPLVRDENGRLMLCSEVDGRRAASIAMKRRRSRLLKWLRDDAHLGPFLCIPSKENGFDVEGIAAKGDRVWIGLRGPVLRGHAVILELQFKLTKRGHLKALRIDGRQRYRKHVFDSAGLGVRDLCFDGTDMLVLVGTPLASDGPARVLRWRDAAYDTTSGVIQPDRLQAVVELPYRGDADHPESMGLLPAPRGGHQGLLVVYDSPHASRLSSRPPQLLADVFGMP